MCNPLGSKIAFLFVTRLRSSPWIFSQPLPHQQFQPTEPSDSVIRAVLILSSVYGIVHLTFQLIRCTSVSLNLFICVACRGTNNRPSSSAMQISSTFIIFTMYPSNPILFCKVVKRCNLREFALPRQSIASTLKPSLSSTDIGSLRISDKMHFVTRRIFVCCCISAFTCTFAFFHSTQQSSFPWRVANAHRSSFRTFCL